MIAAVASLPSCAPHVTTTTEGVQLPLSLTSLTLTALTSASRSCSLGRPEEAAAHFTRRLGGCFERPPTTAASAAPLGPLSEMGPPPARSPLAAGGADEPLRAVPMEL